MTASEKGFTLIEVLLAVFIFAMVISGIYLVLHTALDAYRKGSVHMEMTQSVRIAMSRMEYDLARAVSPVLVWNEPTFDEVLDELLKEEIELDRRSSSDDEYDDGNALQRTEEVKFTGSANEVSFVVSEYLPRQETPYDLREVKYWLDSENKCLMKQYVRSILEVRKMELRAQRSENETEFWSANPRDQIGMLGDDAKIVVGNYIKSLDIRYFNGTEWSREWNSQQMIGQKEAIDEGLSYEDLRDDLFKKGKGQRKGLPKAVEISLQIENNDVLRTIVEIPSSSLNEEDVINETAFRSI